MTQVGVLTIAQKEIEMCEKCRVSQGCPLKTFNAILLDPITNKVYDVIRRRVTTYRRSKYNFLNLNRLPIEFVATLEKGHPLLVMEGEETCYMVVHFETFPPAKKWQNIICKILLTPLEYCEALDKWPKSDELSTT